jgi:hypothetical protein
MSKAAIKTNNDVRFLGCKRSLRRKFVKKGDRILELYAGEGVLWRTLKEEYQLSILSIDKKNYNKVNLQGDNLKWLKRIDLNNFDIIDLDAYGFPARQLDIIFKKQWKGRIFITSIQSGMGRLPNSILFANGYTKEMINKTPTLFCKNPFEKIKNYLAFNGVKKIYWYGNSRKKYVYCELN